MEKNMSRSTSFPVVPIGEAVSRLKELKEGVGLGPYSRETSVKALGYKGISGTSGRMFAALMQFGLLSKTDADKYKISPIGLRIINKIGEEDSRSALQKASLEPALFSKLAEKFEGDRIPQQLANVLLNENNYSFSNENGAKQAAKNFIETLEFAGLMQDGVLRRDNTQDQAQINIEQNHKEEQGQSVPSTSGNNSFRTLPSGITIGFPSELDQAVLFGEFGSEMKSLESKAQRIINNEKADEQDRIPS
jgi:hypothetical protein